MACGSKLIRTNFLPGVSEGGSWELVGYSVEPTGPFNPGGNWPWSSEPSEDPSVNFDNIIPGYYKLNYFKTGVCGGQQSIIIPVTGNGDAGVTDSIELCSNASPINITDLLGTVFEGGILEPEFSYSGSGYTSSGFIKNNPNTPVDDVFDPSLVTPGVYTVTLTVTPQTPPGYTLESCCLPTTASLIITVVEGSATIGLGPNCTLYIDEIVGCTSPTYTLWKNTGSGWTNTGVTSLPYQVSEVANWKIVITSGCTCGSIESNVITSTGCCTAEPVELYFDNVSCFIVVTGTTGCTGASPTNNFKWYRSCDGGSTWEYLPIFDGETFIFVNDSCCYQMVHPCGNGCVSRSNIVCATGCSSCAGSLAASQIGCVYRVAAGPYCEDGIYKLINLTTMAVVATQIATGYPVDFTVPSNGNYAVILDCQNGCPEYSGPGFTFSGCGSTPCTATLGLNLTGCLITASHTNCASPTFTFKRPNGTTAQTGALNTFTADADGLWTVEMTGCPNCFTIISTIWVASCAPNLCVCSPTLSHTPCGSLSTTACSGYTTEWQYRPDPTASWVVVQSGGTTYTATQNGGYRVRYVKSGCPEIYSNIVSITCFTVPCTCIPVLSLNGGTCELTYTATSCAGYVLFLQQLIGGSWVDIEVFPSNPYPVLPDSDGFYRLKATHAACPTVYSNIVNVPCSGGSCSIAITNLENSGCNEITFNWANTSGETPTIEWAYATVNPTDCNTAGGWAYLSVTGSWGQSGLGGSGVVTIEECDVCIRLTITDSCGSAQEKIFIPCCCTDTPYISEEVQSADYKLQLKTPFDPNLVTDVFAADQSGTRNMKIYSIAEYLKSINGGPFTLISSEEVSNTITNVYTFLSKITGATQSSTDFIKEVKFKINGVTKILDLNPTTSPYLTGSFGTVNPAHLYLYDPGVSESNARIALQMLLRNAIKTEAPGLVAEDLYVHIFTAGARSIGVFLRVNWGSISYPDTTTDYFLKHNVSTNHIINTTDQISIFDDPSTTLSISKNYPCGTLTLNTVLNHYPNQYPTQLIIETKASWLIWADPSETFPNYASTDMIKGPYPLWDVYGSSTQSIMASCLETILTVEGACVGSDYLWSTGETTQSITVSSGTYSVLITCPDGCEYLLNYTV